MDALVDVLHYPVFALDVPLFDHLQMPVRGLLFLILASLDALVDVPHYTVSALDVPLVNHLPMPVRGHHV